MTEPAAGSCGNSHLTPRRMRPWPRPYPRAGMGLRGAKKMLQDLRYTAQAADADAGVQSNLTTIQPKRSARRTPIGGTGSLGSGVSWPAGGGAQVALEYAAGGRAAVGDQVHDRTGDVFRLEPGLPHRVEPLVPFPRIVGRWVRQVRAEDPEGVVVEHHRGGDRGRADDVGRYPVGRGLQCHRLDEPYQAPFG